MKGDVLRLEEEDEMQKRANIQENLLNELVKNPAKKSRNLEEEKKPIFNARQVENASTGSQEIEQNSSSDFRNKGIDYAQNCYIGNFNNPKIFQNSEILKIHHTPYSFPSTQNQTYFNKESYFYEPNRNFTRRLPPNMCKEEDYYRINMPNFQQMRIAQNERSFYNFSTNQNFSGWNIGFDERWEGQWRWGEQK